MRDRAQYEAEQRAERARINRANALKSTGPPTAEGKARLEAYYWNLLEYDAQSLGYFTQIQRLMTSTECAFNKALTELRKIQAERRAVEAQRAKEEKNRQAAASLSFVGRPQVPQTKPATAHSGFVPQNGTQVAPNSLVATQAEHKSAQSIEEEQRNLETAA